MVNLGILDEHRLNEGLVPLVESLEKKLDNAHKSITKGIKNLITDSLHNTERISFHIIDNGIKKLMKTINTISEHVDEAKNELGIYGIFDIIAFPIEWIADKFNILLMFSMDGSKMIYKDVMKGVTVVAKKTVNVTMDMGNLFFGPKSLKMEFSFVKDNVKGLIKIGKRMNKVLANQRRHISNYFGRLFATPIKAIKNFLTSPYRLFMKGKNNIDHSIGESFKSFKDRISNTTNSIDRFIKSIDGQEKQAMDKFRDRTFESIENLKTRLFKQVSGLSTLRPSSIDLQGAFQKSFGDQLKHEKIKTEAMKKYPNGFEAMRFIEQIKPVHSLIEDSHHLEKTYKNAGDYWDQLIGILKDKLLVLENKPLMKKDDGEYVTEINGIYRT